MIKADIRNIAKARRFMTVGGSEYQTEASGILVSCGWVCSGPGVPHLAASGKRSHGQHLHPEQRQGVVARTFTGKGAPFQALPK